MRHPCTGIGRQARSCPGWRHARCCPAAAARRTVESHGGDPWSSHSRVLDVAVRSWPIAAGHTRDAFPWRGTDSVGDARVGDHMQRREQSRRLCMTVNRGYFLPQMLSCKAVSPADWNFASLSPRKVRTSAWSADWPSAVMRVSTTT